MNGIEKIKERSNDNIVQINKNIRHVKNAFNTNDKQSCLNMISSIENLIKDIQLTQNSLKRSVK